MIGGIEMISSVTIENFKNFKQAALELAPLTIMIGANASGKSNALEAIRLLSWLARGTRLDDIERNLNGLDSPLHGRMHDLFRDENKPIRLGCRFSDELEPWNRLRLGIEQDHEHYSLASEQVADGSGNILYRISDSSRSLAHQEIFVEYNTFNQDFEWPFAWIPCTNQQAIFYQIETPARFNQEHEKAQRIIPEVTKQFRETLRSIVFLNPQPARMRSYTYYGDLALKEDGSNLSSLLYAIWNHWNRLGEKSCGEYLLDFMRLLPEQNITDIEFIRTERNDVMVRLVESFGNKRHSIDPPLLSDGTLRVLAVAATLLTAPAGALVIIEEFDNGIHPSRADQIIRNMIEVAHLRNLRILLTAHNPALLDALPDQCLGDVLCCYRDPEEGDSRIVQLKNLGRYPELVARGPLGQLMTQGIIDGFLKDKTTSSQRRQAALEWFENFMNEETG